MRIRAFLIASAIGLVGSEASASLIDVADGAAVILNGEYGVLNNFCCGWDPTEPSAAGSTLTDGVLRPQATVWQEGAVWWDATHPGSAANSIEIDLGGFFTLGAFSVQADDNDTYRIEVLNAADVWITVWDIPAVGGFGLQTRPDPSDPTAAFFISSTIVGDRIRFTATGGDGFYSVSEINAYVPEPVSASLLAFALVGSPRFVERLASDFFSASVSLGPVFPRIGEPARALFVESRGAGTLEKSL